LFGYDEFGKGADAVHEYTRPDSAVEYRQPLSLKGMAGNTTLISPLIESTCAEGTCAAAALIASGNMPKRIQVRFTISCPPNGPHITCGDFPVWTQS
jgi:hypothetical protein